MSLFAQELNGFDNNEAPAIVTVPMNFRLVQSVLLLFIFLFSVCFKIAQTHVYAQLILSIIYFSHFLGVIIA